MTQFPIVITQAGCISALSHSFASLHDSMAKVPPLSSRKDFELHNLDSEQPCFAITGFDPVAALGKQGMRTKDWATKILLSTLETQFKTLLDTNDEKSRPGLCVGTAFGSVQSIGDFLSESIVNGVNSVNPQLFANTVINSPTGNANIRYVIRNLSTTVATTFNAGLDAIIYSSDFIKRGYLPAIIAGGLEELSYYALLGMQRSMVLSSSGESHPFAADTDGFLPGEACALFMVESKGSAQSRGANILCEVAGYASGFDCELYNGNVAGKAEVPVHVINQACAAAGCTPSQIGFVASGANGTPLVDAVEIRALEATVGNKVPVTGYKALTGECYGASGALSIACSIADLTNNTISGPPAAYTIKGGLDVVFGRRESGNASTVLITSFSCDGTCSAMVLKKID